MLNTVMKPLFTKHDKTDLAIRLLTAGVPAAPVLEIPVIRCGSISMSAMS
ncbi:MAG: hypothetical protein U1E97_01315 [Alphaproteobacteria bacterium]